MGAQLLKESGAEGEVGRAKRGEAKRVEGMASVAIPGRVGEEAEKAESEIGEEEER